MKKILYFMFILIFLISCQPSSSKKTIITDNSEKASKANLEAEYGPTNGFALNPLTELILIIFPL